MALLMVGSVRCVLLVCSDGVMVPDGLVTNGIRD